MPEIQMGKKAKGTVLILAQGDFSLTVMLS